MEHILDKPVWSALNSGNRNISVGNDTLKAYAPGIAPFVGLIENSKENLLSLSDSFAEDNQPLAIVTTSEIEIPAPWKILQIIPLLQMVCSQPVYGREITADIVGLKEEHIPKMLSLTKLTNPGPFMERTIDFGHYQGIFDGEKLVAMAGQRMHPEPYAEISAVCTHPDYTGKGYAAQLMLSQIKRIVQTGETPFLHVAAENERAISIYRSLGFINRRNMFVYIIKK